MAQTETDGIEVVETREWVDSLDYVLEHGGPNRAGRLLQQLALHARREAGVNLPFSATTPYQNTIPSIQQAPFPGSQEMERRIKSLVRWNALAMVVRANKIQEGIGGHISTFASAATLYEVAFNHFLHAQTETGDRDVVYFQGHAAPGMYARAFLEGRIPKEKLQNFRRELKPGGGLSHSLRLAMVRVLQWVALAGLECRVACTLAPPWLGRCGHPPRTRRILFQSSQAQGQETLSPQLHGGPRELQLRGNVLAQFALGCQANDPGPLHQARRNRSSARPGLQRGLFLCRQDNGRCPSAHDQQHRTSQSISKAIYDALH